MAELLQRLESVTKSLEQYASSVKPAQPTTARPINVGGGGEQGMGAIHEEISKGLDITKGLRHVTDEDKKAAKDGKLEISSVPSSSSSSPSSSSTSSISNFGSVAAPVQNTIEPELFVKKRTWFVKNYTSSVSLKAEDVSLRHNVYVLNCKNCTVTIPSKFKAIQLDQCHKVTIIFNSVVSLVECFNSTRIKLMPQDSCPGVSIDKSSDVEIILGPTCPPPIVTHSNSTDMRLIIPGKTEKSDPVEHFIPHQFFYQIRIRSPCYDSHCTVV